MTQVYIVPQIIVVVDLRICLNQVRAGFNYPRDEIHSLCSKHTTFYQEFFFRAMQRNKNFSSFNINPSLPSKEACQIAKNNIDFLVFFCFLPIEPSFPPIRSNTNNTFLYIRSLLYFIYSIIYFSVKLQIFPPPPHI